MDQQTHDDLVQFLHDTTRLDELMAVPGPEVFDYVVMTRRDRITIGNGSRIDSFVKLEGGTGLTIGRYVHIASFAHVGIGGGEVVIGDFAAIASGGKVIGGSNQMDAATMSACAPERMQRTTQSRTVIGPYAVVLTNATVLPGVTLGEGAVLAAGAVATRDIPAWEVWAGVPARCIAIRAVVRR